MPKKLSKQSTNPWNQWDSRPNNFGPNSKNGRIFSNNYSEHDDRRNDRHPRMERAFPGLNKPRVSFKATSFKNHSKLSRATIRHFDSDVQMGGSNTNNNNEPRGVNIRSRGGRGGRFGRGRNSPAPRGGGVVRDLDGRKHFNEFHFYKVTIFQGRKYSKDYIIGLLLSYIQPVSFVPIMYTIGETNAVFYIDDLRVANKLADIDKRITCNDGYKLSIQVKQDIPNTNIDDALKEKIKQVLGKRYVIEKKALDLSNFHQNEEIIDEYFCPLSKAQILEAVINIVAEHVPNLEALNLENNKILHIGKCGFIGDKLKNLKILYLGDNKIKNVNQLQSLKNLKLTELRLAGNPLCQNYDSKDDEYVRDVRDKFPNLMKLDGKDLPAPIGFDLADEKLKLPEYRNLYFNNGDAKDKASQFLQQYFIIYDSDSRQPLLDAYHEKAVFSLNLYPSQNNKYPDVYYRFNRNIKRFSNPDDKIRTCRTLLHKEKLQVVAYISKLPKTKHDLDRFSMDVVLVPGDMMIVTVTGIFKELDHINTKRDILRYFNRTFIIIPQNAGFCIINEQLNLSDPTSKQGKEAFTTQAQVVDNSKIPQNLSIELTEDKKAAMTMILSQQTNMNIEYSRQCLETVQWNFDSARGAFQEAYSAGKIPPEAFQK